MGIQSKKLYYKETTLTFINPVILYKFIEKIRDRCTFKVSIVRKPLIGGKTGCYCSMPATYNRNNAIFILFDFFLAIIAAFLLYLCCGMLCENDKQLHNKLII